MAKWVVPVKNLYSYLFKNLIVILSPGLFFSCPGAFHAGEKAALFSSLQDLIFSLKTPPLRSMITILGPPACSVRDVRHQKGRKRADPAALLGERYGMKKERIFEILGIDETKEEKTLQDAYREKLRVYNPEDDPEGFKRLRAAYEEALVLARRRDEAEEPEESESDRWMDRLDMIYEDITSRCDTEQWREVLKDPLCLELDTYLEARSTLFYWVSDHPFLPQEVWKLFDAAFQIEADRESIAQDFSENLIDSILYSARHPSFFNYDLFQVTDRKKQDPDTFISVCMNVKRLLDEGETKDVKRLLSSLSSYGISHPYADVEKLRFLLKTGQEEQAVLEAGRLMDDYGEAQDAYLMSWCAEAFRETGDKKRAEVIWEEVLKKAPGHARALLGLASCLYERGDFTGAKELEKRLLLKPESRENREFEELLFATNRELIPVYEKRLSAPGETEEAQASDCMELAWCCFQNGELLRARAALERIPAADQERSEYLRLKGSLLSSMGEYGEAYSLLKEWMKRTGTDGEEELSLQLLCLLSECAHALKKGQDALEYIQKAGTLAGDFRELTFCKKKETALLFDLGEYERVIDLCDSLLREDQYYYPAYAWRMRAAFESNRVFQLLSDFRLTSRLFPEKSEPWLFAASAYCKNVKYEEALHVLKMAEEKGIAFTDRMILCELEAGRHLAESQAERSVLRKKGEALLKRGKTKDSDVEDFSEIAYQIACLFIDDDRLFDAMDFLDQAVAMNPKRLVYRLLRANLFMEMKNFPAALEAFMEAAPAYLSSPSFYYGRGQCYGELGFWSLAAADFMKTLEMRPNYRDSLARVGISWRERYRKSGRRADADTSMAYLERQLSIRPTCFCLVARGRLFLLLGEIESALDDFSQALKLDPRCWEAYLYLGRCEIAKRQYESALSVLEKADQLQDAKRAMSPGPLTLTAECLEIMGEYEKALSVCRKITKYYGDSPALRERMGRLFCALNEPEKALSVYENGMDDPAYCAGAADALSQMGDAKQAVRLLKQGIKSAKQEEKAFRYADLARYFALRERAFRKAGYFYKKALSLLSEQDDEEEDRRREWLFSLALLCYHQGQRREAKKLSAKWMESFARSGYNMEEYVGFAPFAKRRAIQAAWLHILAGDGERGVSELKALGSASRREARLLSARDQSQLYLGWYYESNKDYKNALECYRKAAGGEGGRGLEIFVKAMEKKAEKL